MRVKIIKKPDTEEQIETPEGQLLDERMQEQQYMQLQNTPPDATQEEQMSEDLIMQLMAMQQMMQQQMQQQQMQGGMPQERMSQNAMGLFALGGVLGGYHTNGTDWMLPGNLKIINAGGTHEQNKNEGVLLGTDSEGTPNLVEENEVIYNDYVFSNRLKVPKRRKISDKEISNLSWEEKMLKPYEGMTYADAAKKAYKSAEERPDDLIEKRGLEVFLGILAGSLEKERAKKQHLDSAKDITNMSGTEFLQMQEQEKQALLMTQELQMQLMQEQLMQLQQQDSQYMGQLPVNEQLAMQELMMQLQMGLGMNPNQMDPYQMQLMQQMQQQMPIDPYQMQLQMPSLDMAMIQQQGAYMQACGGKNIRARGGYMPSSLLVDTQNYEQIFNQIAQYAIQNLFNRPDLYEAVLLVKTPLLMMEFVQAYLLQQQQQRIARQLYAFGGNMVNKFDGETPLKGDVQKLHFRNKVGLEATIVYTEGDNELPIFYIDGEQVDINSFLEGFMGLKNTSLTTLNMNTELIRALTKRTMNTLLRSPIYRQFEPTGPDSGHISTNSYLDLITDKNGNLMVPYWHQENNGVWYPTEGDYYSFEDYISSLDKDEAAERLKERNLGPISTLPDTLWKGTTNQQPQTSNFSQSTAQSQSTRHRLEWTDPNGKKWHLGPTGQVNLRGAKLYGFISEDGKEVSPKYTNWLIKASNASMSDLVNMDDDQWQRLMPYLNNFAYIMQSKSPTKPQLSLSQLPINTSTLSTQESQLVQTSQPAQPAQSPRQALTSLTPLTRMTTLNAGQSLRTLQPAKQTLPLSGYLDKQQALRKTLTNLNLHLVATLDLIDLIQINPQNSEFGPEKYPLWLTDGTDNVNIDDAYNYIMAEPLDFKEEDESQQRRVTPQVLQSATPQLQYEELSKQLDELNDKQYEKAKSIVDKMWLGRGLNPGTQGELLYNRYLQDIITVAKGRADKGKYSPNEDESLFAYNYNKDYRRLNLLNAYNDAIRDAYKDYLTELTPDKDGRLGFDLEYPGLLRVNFGDVTAQDYYNNLLNGSDIDAATTGGLYNLTPASGTDINGLNPYFKSNDDVRDFYQLLILDYYKQIGLAKPKDTLKETVPRRLTGELARQWYQLLMQGNPRQRELARLIKANWDNGNLDWDNGDWKFEWEDKANGIREHGDYKKWATANFIGDDLRLKIDSRLGLQHFPYLEALQGQMTPASGERYFIKTGPNDDDIAWIMKPEGNDWTIGEGVKNGAYTDYEITPKNLNRNIIRIGDKVYRYNGPDDDLNKYFHPIDLVYQDADLPLGYSNTSNYYEAGPKKNGKNGTAGIGDPEYDPFPRPDMWPFYTAWGLGTLGLLNNIFSPIDYSNANALIEASKRAGQYKPVIGRPIGDYLAYNPLDRNYEGNKISSKMLGEQRMLANLSNGNRGTAAANILTSDNNYITLLGDVDRKAAESNRAHRQEVATFNKDTEKYNSDMAYQVSKANSDAYAKSGDTMLSGLAQGYKMRLDIKDDREDAISASISGLEDAFMAYANTKWRNELLGWDMRHRPGMAMTQEDSNNPNGHWYNGLWYDNSNGRTNAAHGGKLRTRRKKGYNLD